MSEEGSSSPVHGGKRIIDVEDPVSVVETRKGPLTFDEVEARRAEHGLNKIVTEKRIPWYMILLQALFHPFNILLCIIAVSSAVADEFSTTIIISVMIVISSSLRFYQELKSEGAVHSLLKLVTKSVTTIRYDNIDHVAREIDVPAEELVPGDWIVLRPGEIVPADSVLLTSKVFFVSQAPLTGEAIPVEKYPSEEESLVKDASFDEERKVSYEERTKRISSHKPMSNCQRFFRIIFGMKIKTDAHLDKSGYELKEDLSYYDHVFMGCQIITGTATARVVRIGQETLFGRMAEALAKQQPVNPFQQGVKRISWIFFLTMALMIPPVLLIQGFIQKDWQQAFIFSLSVAVGLTPEMLPMIVNANLAKGSVKMTEKKSIVKKMDAIINLGAVDILCTDKTGTLTKSIVQLSAHLGTNGETSNFSLHLAFLNSYLQSVLKNPLDSAITAYFVNSVSPDPVLQKKKDGDSLSRIQREIQPNDIDTFLKQYTRLDELPFDFVRRRLSIAVQDNQSKKVYLVCKGAVEETLAVCTKVVDADATSKFMIDVFPPESNIKPLPETLRETLMDQYATYTAQGQRVLGVSFKPLATTKSAVTYEDESEMVFVGFLSFVDPPKETAKNAIAELTKHNVEIKVLTGDSPNICSTVCKLIKLPVKAVVTSDDIDKAHAIGNLAELVEQGTIFAKLTPLQKSLVVHTLKTENNHVVGFMGDGINDAPALKEADVGISVDNGVDICRESADVILLDKDLNAVVTGIRIGRETYGNTIKYIAMAVSSNFGNVFSVLVASAWLPFEPMQSLHLLTQNLLYDISQIAIPWDNMDEDFLMVPHKWKMKSIMRFMVWMGPWSSVFDITTFAFMYFYKGVTKKDDVQGVKLFQTTWFTVGLLTQTLIVHMIRTAKIPIFQSRASISLTILTLVIMAAGLALPYVPIISEKLDFTNKITIDIYYFLICVLAAYCFVANIAKCIYIQIFKEWF